MRPTVPKAWVDLWAFKNDDARGHVAEKYLFRNGICHYE